MLYCDAAEPQEREAAEVQRVEALAQKRHDAEYEFKHKAKKKEAYQAYDTLLVKRIQVSIYIAWIRHKSMTGVLSLSIYLYIYIYIFSLSISSL